MEDAMDPDELLREIYKKRKDNLFFALKTLWRLWVVLNLTKFKLWATNRCLKCGFKFVLYRIHKKFRKEKRIKVCEFCCRLNPNNIVVNREEFFGQVVSERKVYAGPFHGAVYIVVMISLLVLLFWACGGKKNSAGISDKGSDSQQMNKVREVYIEVGPTR